MRHELRPGDEPVPGLRLTGRFNESAVWRAVDAAGRAVVVRFVDLGTGRRSPDRGRTVAGHADIRHPNLVPIEAVHLFETSGYRPTAAVVMPPAVTDLDDLRTARRDGLPAEEVRPILAGAAAALDFLHFVYPAGPIRHGRLRPSKLLLAADGVWLSDFARPDPYEDNLAVVRPGDSPLYAAPELIRGQPGPASDQYALALVYYEARTGRLPFPTADGSVHVMMRHIRGDLDLSAPGLSDPERQVLRWATALDPAARYPTCGDFAAELERAAGGRPPRSPDELQRPR